MSDGMELATSVTVSDGTTAAVGDVLYGGDGRAWRVVGIDPCRTGRPILARSDDRERLYRELRPGWMTSRRRDTMGTLQGFASMSMREYWDCVGVGCNACPVAARRGRRPCEAYGCGSCFAAMELDIMRRAYEVGRRGGEPMPAPDWGGAADGK